MLSHEVMATFPVVVRYTARAGQAATLRNLVARHWGVLHEEGLTTRRAAVVIEVDRHAGVFIEYYEWLSQEAVRTAHDHPAVRDLWDQMERMGTVEPWDGTYVAPPPGA